MYPLTTTTDATIATYPSNQIDPKKKGYDWILQYVKAAYNDSNGYMTNGVLNVGKLKMSQIKMYSMGKQDVDKYKKMFSPGNPSDESWRAIDWTPPGFMCKFRDIAISKILQKEFDIQAYAIDPLARSEEDEYFNKMKVKIMMREAAQQAGSELADSPMLAPQPGEPEDMEQLLMAKEFGYKHVMAMEAEEAAQLIMQQNNVQEKRKVSVTNLVDFGIGGYTPWIDENGMVKFREINPEYLGLSYCEKPDFSDLTHWYEIVPTYVADLAPYYTKDQLDDICKKVLSRNGNPSKYTAIAGGFNQAWNRFQVFVLQIKFLSWNDTVYKTERDNRSNVRFGKSSYENKQFLAVDSVGSLTENDDSYNDPIGEHGEQGQATPKYINSCKKVVYKASWVIDTDYMHNWGLKENQNRKLSSWWDTDLDIQLYGWNFYRMQFAGLTERLIPLEDKACMAWFNLQNLSNKLIPYLINIDFNAVEAVNFGKGGGKAKPSEIIDFIFSNYVVPYRSTDLLSRNPNYKPVSIEATGQLAAFSQLYEELQHTIEMMRQVTGLNEVTDGSTINQKTLNGATEAMQQSTNNALYLISLADKNLTQRLADAIIQKVQIAVKLGKVEGYAKALGSSTVKFLQINPDIALHELGIFIEEAPTQMQREMLWQDVTIKESQGLLTVGDKIMIMSCRNLKQAAMLLDYKIQKRKEEAHQQQMQLVQQQTEGNMQTAQQAAEMQGQFAEMQNQLDLIKINAEKQWEFEIESMKKSVDLQGEMIQTEGRNVGHQIQSQAKVIASHIAAEASLAKQDLANKKPKPTAKASK